MPSLARRGFWISLVAVIVLAAGGVSMWRFSGDVWEWLFWNTPRYQLVAAPGLRGVVVRLNTHTGAMAVFLVSREDDMERLGLITPYPMGDVKGPGSP